MILTERKVRFHARFVSLIDTGHFPELTFAFRALQPKQMTAGRLRTQNFAAASDFKPFRDRFACFTARNGFRHEARKIGAMAILTTGFRFAVEPLAFCGDC